jgi:Carboxypeptidase regulatory-like domain
MRMTQLGVTTLVILLAPVRFVAGPGSATISGRITVSGTLPKPKPLDMSKEPACLKMHGQPVFPETLVTGPENSLRNVVVYISAGPPENSPPPVSAVTYDQRGCQYTTHVLALHTAQEVKISNSDSIGHNIHPLAKINREWNKIQPPGTPPFSYAYDSEEFIPVKCNIHPWMQGFFAVLRTSHFSVTGDDGGFRLPDLPPGHYTLTAWHESLGTQTQQINVAGGESQTLNFIFVAKP